MCPSSGENYCIYAALVFVTLWVASGLMIGFPAKCLQTPGFIENWQKNKHRVKSRSIRCLCFVNKTEINQTF